MEFRYATITFLRLANWALCSLLAGQPGKAVPGHHAAGSAGR